MYLDSLSIKKTQLLDKVISKTLQRNNFSNVLSHEPQIGVDDAAIEGKNRISDLIRYVPHYTRNVSQRSCTQISNRFSIY